MQRRRCLRLNTHCRQSQEMETLMGRGDASSLLVERLVAKHVDEMAALERRWDSERAESKRRQRVAYRDDIMALCAAVYEQRRGGGTALSSPRRRAAPVVSVTAPPSPHHAEEGATAKLAGSVRGAARSLFSLRRKGRSPTTPPPSTSTTPSSSSSPTTA